MARRRGHRPGLALAVCAVLALGACGGGGSEPDQEAVEATAGGTLTLLQRSDFDHLDPARTYVTNAANFSRLLYRGLTTYAVGDTVEIVPDLATDLGRSTDDKTWTYTLKEGVRYEDGSEVTSADVKYGIERTFAAELTGGAKFHQLYLDPLNKYKGPYNGGGELATIETPDKRTIVFKLAQPNPDWPFLMAQPFTAGVPKEKDTGVTYDERVFSSGPYKIETYRRARDLTLVRNDQWDPATDKVRAAYPDKIVVRMSIDPKTIDEQLIRDSEADRASATLDSGVQAENLARVLEDKDLLDRTLAGPTGCNYFLALNTRRLGELKVRQALNYATDKQAWRGVLGGETAGAYSTTILPSSLGGNGYNAYEAPPAGDPDQARSLLEEAGAADLTVSLAVNDSDAALLGAQALQAGWEKAGITTEIEPLPDADYYGLVGDTSKQYDVMVGGWCPEYASAARYIPPLLDGASITKTANTNWSLLDDPKVNTSIADIQAIDDVTQRAAAWVALDQEIMQSHAPIVPLVEDSIFVLHGSGIGGVRLAPAFGSVDALALWVRR